MVRPNAELQLEHHVPGNLVLGHHALNGKFEDPMGLALEQLPRGLVTLSAGISRIPLIGFLAPFLAREHNLVDVGHDDVIASVNVRSIRGAVLPHQDGSNLSGQATDDRTFGVDHIPMLG